MAEFIHSVLVLSAEIDSVALDFLLQFLNPEEGGCQLTKEEATS